MDNVNKTLYISLYGKAYVSKKKLFVDDKKSEEIWEAEEFTLNKKSKSKWLAYYMGIRSAVFDEWVKKQMSELQDAVVIHIGCGLDSRVIRVGTGNHKWYDVDFLEIIEKRKKYYTNTNTYKMIAGDARNCKWLTTIEEHYSAIVVMEGVSMYLTVENMKNLIDSLCTHFEKIVILVDCYTSLGAKMSKRGNPINSVGVNEVYGIDSPEAYQSEKIAFVKEYNMIPKKYIDELKGLERLFFAKIYTGGFSKKLYRLYEYKKTNKI